MEQTDQTPATKKGKIELDVDVIEKVMRLQKYGETYSETLRRILMKYAMGEAQQNRKKSKIDSNVELTRMNRRARISFKQPPISEKDFEEKMKTLPKQCVRCGSTTSLLIDHIIAYSRGGKHTVDNLQILCRDCHTHKSKEDHKLPKVIL